MNFRCICLGVLSATTLLLSACSSKPPNCGDSDTLASIKSIIVNSIDKNYSKSIALNDPDGILKKFTDSLKVEISNIVSEGYDEGAKRFSCRGELKVTTITGDTASREVSYSTQSTEGDADSKFITRVAAFDEFIFFSTRHADKYYDSTRWAGTWNGSLSCEGIAGASEGAAGPFQTPVAMTIDGKSASMVINIQGGYEQPFGGTITTVAGIMRVPGSLNLYPRTPGASLSGPQHLLFKNGRFTPNGFEADGETYSSKRSLQRSCKLLLKRGGELPKVQNLAEAPVLFMEDEQRGDAGGTERLQLLLDPEFLAGGSGVRFETNKGPLVIRSYDYPSFVISLKKGDCVVVHSTGPVNFGESRDSNVEKLSPCGS